MALFTFLTQETETRAARYDWFSPVNESDLARTTVEMLNGYEIVELDVHVVDLIGGFIGQQETTLG